MHFSRNYFIINIRRVVNISTFLTFIFSLNGFSQIKKVRAKVVEQSLVQKTEIKGYALTEFEDAGVDRSIGKIISANGQLASFSLSEKPNKLFEKYVSQNYSFTNIYKQVRITIKQVSLEETPAKNGGVDGRLSLQFTFEVIKGDELYAHLMNYKGAIRYTRLLNQVKVPEEYLADGFKNALKVFDDWFEKNKNENALLAQSVTVKFNDYTETPEGDTIYYSAKRPLTWADFKERPRAGIYAAEVMAGLGFVEGETVKDGVIMIEIGVKTYLPKSASWVKTGEENDVNLNHEQRHFDIVKIVGERFKQRLQQEKLPVYNYGGYINVAYIDALREVTALQLQYDTETVHGSNLVEQQRWNNKIDAELKEIISGG